LIKIPEPLKRRDLKFIKVKERDKRAVEKNWQLYRNYEYNDDELVKWIEDGKNYGVLAGINNLVILDFDHPTQEMKKELLKIMPETFVVRTGSGGLHFYYFADRKVKNRRIERGDGVGLDIQASRKFVVGPNSIHPSGNLYLVVKNKEITRVNWKKIEELLKQFGFGTEELVNKYVMENENVKGSIIAVLEKWKPGIMKEMKIYHDEYYGAHPLHGSTTGRNFYVNPTKNVWYCFRHGIGGGILSLIALLEGMVTCEELVEKGFTTDKLKKAIDIAREKYDIIIESREDVLKKMIMNAMEHKEGFYELAKELIKVLPIYYDENHIWWLWDPTEKRWKMVDETEILRISINTMKYAGILTESNKRVFFNAVQVVSRENKPQEPPKSWIQFKNKIVDIETGEIIEPSPKWFMINVIPWELGRNVETPMIDKLFIDWVGEEYKQTLYEVIAYSMLRDYPIHRLFCLVGSGRNGKGSFMRLLAKILGKENTTSTDLDRLMTSRFETARLYKKLVAFMGETNFNILERTAIIKQLTGQDLIAAEFKNKPAFDFYNYAKIIIATNSLPMTKDKTEGFYSRWIIIDFPNQFNRGKDVVELIPDEEFENLALKSLNILKELLNRGSFLNEGSIKEKMLKYEEKSNPVKKFIEIYVEKDPEGYIPVYEFKEKLVGFLKERGYRIYTSREISSIMEEEGFEKRKKSINVDNETKKWWCYLGIKWKKGNEDEQSSKSSTSSGTLYPYSTIHSKINRNIWNYWNSWNQDNKSPQEIKVKSENKEDLVLSLIPFGKNVSYAEVEKANLEKNIVPHHEFHDIINKLLKEGLLFEPRPGYLRKVNP